MSLVTFNFHRAARIKQIKHAHVKSPKKSLTETRSSIVSSPCPLLSRTHRYYIIIKRIIHREFRIFVFFFFLMLCPYLLPIVLANVLRIKPNYLSILPLKNFSFITINFSLSHIYDRVCQFYTNKNHSEWSIVHACRLYNARFYAPVYTHKDAFVTTFYDGRERLKGVVNIHEQENCSNFPNE